MKTIIAITCALLALPSSTMADEAVAELTNQSPTWDRPSNNNQMNAGQCGSTSADDSVNDQVPFARFYVRAIDNNVPMDVTVTSLEAEPLDFDPFVAVYCEEFDPTAPDNGLFGVDDDSAGYPNAHLSPNVPLEQELDHIIIVSSYSNWQQSRYGKFVVTIGEGLEFFNPCPADLNSDGVLNFFDVSAFLSAFNAMNPAADFNNDGLFNFFDVSAFLVAYNQGCP
jgi:hypothetical protein